MVFAPNLWNIGRNKAGDSRVKRYVSEWILRRTKELGEDLNSRWKSGIVYFKDDNTKMYVNELNEDITKLDRALWKK